MHNQAAYTIVYYCMPSLSFHTLTTAALLLLIKGKSKGLYRRLLYPAQLSSSTRTLSADCECRQKGQHNSQPML